jgi:hypothetical protein
MLSALFSETPGDPIPIAAEVVAAAPRKDSLRLPGQLDFQDVSTSEFDWFIWRGQSTSGEHYIKRVHHDGRQFLWSAPVEDWNNSVAITDSRWIGK